MKKLISHLDEQRFGFKVAKVNSWNTDTENMLKELRKLDVKLVISRIPCENIQTINELESYGFVIKDTQLTYKLSLKHLPFEKIINPANILVRDVMDTDIPIIEDITHDAFIGYGHYFANKRLDSKRCAEIYPDWAKNCCTNKTFANKVLVALMNDKLAGYMAFQLHDNQSTKYASANISVVSPEARGHGIYQLLMKHGLHWCAGYNAEWLEGNAVTVNYPVNHALPKMGFKMTNSHHTLHCWLDS